MTKLKQINLNMIQRERKDETFALSSGELEKYEYQTGEDLGHKPGVNEKAKFEYSSISRLMMMTLIVQTNAQIRAWSWIYCCGFYRPELSWPQSPDVTH